MGCKCINKDMTFTYSHKLRVPTSTRNKAKFRKFLDDCPQFINMVQEHQREALIELLRDLKYFNKFERLKWANISK